MSSKNTLHYKRHSRHTEWLKRDCLNFMEYGLMDMISLLARVVAAAGCGGELNNNHVR